MAVANIAKTVYRPGVLRALERSLVLGSSPIMRGALSDTEASSMVAGGRVQVETVGGISSGVYDASTDLKTALSDLSTSKTVIELDQKYYSGFTLEQVDEIQAAQALLRPAAQAEMGSVLAEGIEEYIAALYTDMTAGPGTEASPVSAATASDLYDDVLVPLAETLSENNVPREGRFCVIAPSLTSKLMLDSRFVAVGSQGSDDRLANGVIARAAGFDLYESNSLAATSPGVGIKVIAGHPSGWAMAHNITPGMVRTIEQESRMGYQFAMIAVYGAAVLDSARLCRAIVSA